MSTKQKAIYSYNGNTDFIFSGRFKWPGIIIIPLILGFFLFHYNKSLLVIPVVLFLILLILKQLNPNQILIEKSFFILDKKVYFYSGLSKIEVNKSQSIAKFYLSKGKHLTIYRNNFPTGAKKEDKIRFNKMRTFNKVIDKIITNAKAENPELICRLEEQFK